MIIENHALWGEEPTEDYPATFTYLGAEPLPDKPNGRRPAVIICGGGGFTHIAPHEQDPVAFAFLDRGYQAFVLNYVTSATGDVSFPHPQADLAKMVATVRANADEWHVDPKRVCIVGFSAGGMICASLATQWKTGPFAGLAGLVRRIFVPTPWCWAIRCSTLPMCAICRRATRASTCACPRRVARRGAICSTTICRW